MNSYYAKLNEIVDEMAHVVQLREQAPEEEKAGLQMQYELLKAEFNQITRARHVDYLHDEPIRPVSDAFLAKLDVDNNLNDHSSTSS